MNGDYGGIEPESWPNDRCTRLDPSLGGNDFMPVVRQRLFPDETFADLFASGRGRPSIPADVIASVMVLQALHGRSDRQTAEAVTFDLR